MEGILNRSSIAVILLHLTVISFTNRQVGKSIPRSVPEVEGVSSHTMLSSAYDGTPGNKTLYSNLRLIAKDVFTKISWFCNKQLKLI